MHESHELDVKDTKRETASNMRLCGIAPSASILARREGWSWPCAVFVPFMVPVFVYSMVHETWVVLRQRGVRWRDTFYSLETLRKGNVG